MGVTRKCWKAEKALQHDTKVQQLVSLTKILTMMMLQKKLLQTNSRKQQDYQNYLHL